eukprot:scaffold31809_cov38-Attheya_sp.AAC.3
MSGEKVNVSNPLAAIATMLDMDRMLHRPFDPSKEPDIQFRPMQQSMLDGMHNMLSNKLVHSIALASSLLAQTSIEGGTKRDGELAVRKRNRDTTRKRDPPRGLAMAFHSSRHRGTP